MDFKQFDHTSTLFDHFRIMNISFIVLISGFVYYFTKFIAQIC